VKEAIKVFSRSQKAYIDGLWKVEEEKLRKTKLEDSPKASFFPGNSA